MIDDQRAAANIRTTLAGALIAAAIAALGAQAAIFAFTFDTEEPTNWFYAWSALAFVGLMASVYFGAKGITEIYKEGYGGAWSATTGHGNLNMQALCSLVAVITLTFSVWSGVPKADDALKQAQEEIARANQSISALQSQVAALASQNAQTQKDVATLKKAGAAGAGKQGGKKQTTRKR